jgi:hypothetical protein
MVLMTDTRSQRKQLSPDILDVDPHERAARQVAEKFALPLAVATVVVHAAGLGGARQ